MKLKIYISFVLIFLISIQFTQAQVIASDDVVLCDGQQGNTSVTLTATSFAVDLTDSNIYSDDTFGGIVDMGFNFVFYGNTYNQVVLSSNNYLSFNTANANGYSDYTIGAAIPTNLEPETQNGILCPWQDIYPGVNGNGTIQYATTGEAPNRVFIASFCGIPMFSCTDICYSSQIKLFETTNIIETHIAQKVLCTTWNGGNAIHGLHNIDGTIAHVVTGLDGIVRNYPNQWTCENDGWRFTPNGDADYIMESIDFSPAVAGTDIVWQDQFGNQIGTGGEIEVFPGGDVTYTAGASLCGSAGDWCGFEGGIEGDDVNITFEELSIIGEITGEISCFNASDGVVLITAPDDGEWNYELYLDGETYQSIESTNNEEYFENLPPGAYSATITEINSGCITEEWTIELVQPEALTQTYTTQNTTCYNGNDGSISIELNGGNGSYTTTLMSLDSDDVSQNGSTITFNNLQPGDYVFFPTDINDCELEFPEDEVFFTIAQPDELVASVSVTDPLCNGGNDGFAELTVSGSNPPYTMEDLSDLEAGTYTTIIADANDCETSIDFTVSEPSALSAFANIIEPLCNGGDDGSAEIIVSGGNAPYLVEDLNNLSAGTYTTIVSDANGCEISIDFTVSEPEEISISEIRSDYSGYCVSCFGGNDGFIDITINGGTEGDGYTYIWSNGETSEDISNLSTGLYSVTVIDANSCSKSIELEITEPTELLLLSESYSSDTYEDFCEDVQDGWINIDVLGGVEDYIYSWYKDGALYSSEEDISELENGNYEVNVEDNNGCIKSLPFTILENEELIIDSDVSECIEDTGSISVTMNGCAGTCEYTWTNENGEIISTSSDVDELEIGDYSVVVQDVFGCSIQRDFTINARPIADFELEEDQFNLSNIPTEFTDLSYDVNIDQWDWNFGDGNNTTVYGNNPVTHLYTIPGTYYVTLSVTDQDGCSNEITKKIEVLQEYYSYTPSIFTPNNDGLNDTFKPSLLHVDKKSYTMIIFDRWGDEVFYTNDYDKGWDGKLKNGELLPPDVYSYKILYSTSVGGEQEEKGKLIMAK